MERHRGPGFMPCALCLAVLAACSAGPQREPPQPVSEAPPTSMPEPPPEPPPTPLPKAPPEPPPAPVSTDAFGVAMLYPTKEGGETWALSEDPSTDTRFKPQAPLERNADGSWKVRGSRVRLLVFTSAGYQRTAIATYDRRLLARTGTMQSPSDWKNVEMTGYVRLNSQPKQNDNFSWYARGGDHNLSIPCEGSAYKAALHYDGTARWLKESWHVSYAETPFVQATSALRGRWVGLKAIMHNVTTSGREAVRLELWLDDDDDPRTWTQVYALTDDGTWGGDSSRCGATDKAMPMTWGGPIAAFRWDGAPDVDFKWLSVREIQ